MTEAETPILRAEFATFQQEIRSDMREVRDGMVRADARADQADKRMGSMETQFAQGLTDIRNDIQSLRSVRSWVIGGLAAAGSAAGAALYHALMAGLS